VDAWCGGEGRPHQTTDLYQIGGLHSIWIGLCQAASGIFPGTSRSMATISGGQLVGMTRPLALEFSFLLSIPTMLAASGYDLLRTVLHSRTSSGLGVVQLDLHGAMLLLIGGLVSFVVAYISVAWFMRWVRHHGFIPFAIYRIAVGALLLGFASHFVP
jgi:undecaprenyl-diphosphatase